MISTSTLAESLTDDTRRKLIALICSYGEDVGVDFDGAILNKGLSDSAEVEIKNMADGEHVIHELCHAALEGVVPDKRFPSLSYTLGDIIASSRRHSVQDMGEVDAMAVEINVLRWMGFDSLKVVRAVKHAINVSARKFRYKGGYLSPVRMVLKRINEPRVLVATEVVKKRVMELHASIGVTNVE